MSVFALSACQQAAWKAGASADDLKRDEQACRAQISENATIQQCLRDKGWTVTEAAPVDSNETAAPTNAAPAAAAMGGAAASAPAPKPAAPDPLQQESIQTWWKAGAQAADFNVDANACLEQLGTPHTPDYVQHLYTHAMVSCLRARGWSAGHDPVYTPLR